MFFILLIPGLLALDLLLWRWAHIRLRGLQPPRLRAGARSVLAVLAMTLVGGYCWTIGSRFIGFREMLPTGIVAVLYIWHLLIAPTTAVIVLLSGSVRWVRARIARCLERGWKAAPTEIALPPTSAPTRRQILAAAAVTLPPLATVFATGAGMGQLDAFRIRRIDLPLVDLPPALDGLTIAQVSDIHIGRFTRPGILAKLREATNSLRADLVLMTGDLIDFRLSDLAAGIDLVHGLDPRYGLLTIEGNHDLFEDRNAFEQRVQNAGIPLLLNESATVRIRGVDVQLLGIRWGAYGNRGAQYQQHMQATLPLLHRDKDTFPILMAHHPHAFDAAADAGIPLTLAGHTHGGQLMLSDSIGAGPIMFKYWSGVYRRANSALVVSNGVGNWFPLRINAPAEIVHITLRRS